MFILKYIFCSECCKYVKIDDMIGRHEVLHHTLKLIPEPEYEHQTISNKSDFQVHTTSTIAVMLHNQPSKVILESTPNPALREAYVEKAKLAEKAHRYDDMLNAMRTLAKLNVDLDVEERNLLSRAYNSVVNPKRGSGRVVLAMETKQEELSTEKLEQIRRYRQELDEELEGLIQDMLRLLDENLIPFALSDESNVFYYKLKGDYHRYKAEFYEGNNRNLEIEHVLEAYSTAHNLATILAPTNPVKLGLALNFSVFHFEMLNNPEKARQIAKVAFDEGMAELPSFPEEKFKESAAILRLLRENLKVWSK